MLNSLFNPINRNDFDKTKLQVNHQAAAATITAGTTGNVDLTLSDDHLFMGIEVIAKGSLFGDKITMQVVTISGYGPYPAGTVLSQFATDVICGDDQQIKFNEESIYPAKIPGLLTLRLKYQSTGTVDVQVAANYKLHKVLV